MKITLITGICTLLFLCSTNLFGQETNYLQEGNNCFEKGDYECARKYYIAYKNIVNERDGLNKAQLATNCRDWLKTANDYFTAKDYANAKLYYEKIRQANPNDSYVKQRLDLCDTNLKPVPGNNAQSNIPATTNSRHPAEPEMVFVKGGTFTMGCTNEQGSDCSNAERPPHSVTVSGFSIGKYEATQAQWQAIMGSNPSFFKGENLPVEKVSWNDVQEFIRKLNAATGKNYRLPTEAEWEYAARGGSQGRDYKYSGSLNISDVAWFTDNSGNKTHPVGTKKPNELGIYDMSGNVWEWCSDWYGDYSNSSQLNPSGPSLGSSRVLRGGSWNYFASYCRVSNRNGNAPGFRNSNIGFRLVLPL